MKTLKYEGNYSKYELNRDRANRVSKIACRKVLNMFKIGNILVHDSVYI